MTLIIFSAQFNICSQVILFCIHVCGVQFNGCVTVSVIPRPCLQESGDMQFKSLAQRRSHQYINCIKTRLLQTMSFDK